MPEETISVALGRGHSCSVPWHRELTTDEASGGPAVGEPVVGLAAALRARSVLAQAGGTFLTGLQGDVGHPVATSGAVAEWVEEGGAPMPGALTFASRPLVPATLSAAVPFSRRLALMATPDVDALLEADLAAALATEIDATALGVSAEASAGGVGVAAELLAANAETTFAAAAPTWSEILALKSATLAANAPGPYSWVTSPAMAATLAQTERAAGSGFILDAGRIDGDPVRVTSAMPDGDLLFGGFSDMVVATFGPGVDLRIDRTTAAASDGRVARAFVDVAFALRRPASFALGVAP